MARGGGGGTSQSTLHKEVNDVEEHRRVWSMEHTAMGTGRARWERAACGRCRNDRHDKTLTHGLGDPPQLACRQLQECASYSVSRAGWRSSNLQRSRDHLFTWNSRESVASKIPQRYELFLTASTGSRARQTSPTACAPAATWQPPDGQWSERRRPCTARARAHQRRHTRGWGPTRPPQRNSEAVHTRCAPPHRRARGPLPPAHDIQGGHVEAGVKQESSQRHTMHQQLPV